MSGDGAASSSVWSFFFHSGVEFFLPFLEQSECGQPVACKGPGLHLGAHAVLAQVVERQHSVGVPFDLGEVSGATTSIDQEEQGIANVREPACLLLIPPEGELRGAGDVEVFEKPAQLERREEVGLEELAFGQAVEVQVEVGQD
jgi:hypothetical protein